MKLISKIILMMYLCVALNGMAYAAGSISAGIGVLNINSCAADFYEQKYNQIPRPDVNLYTKNALTVFVQDIPKMNGFDWSEVREENKKLSAFLYEI